MVKQASRPYTVKNNKYKGFCVTRMVFIIKYPKNKAMATLPTSPAKAFAFFLILKNPKTAQEMPTIINNSLSSPWMGSQAKLTIATREYSTVIPLMPSIKLKMFTQPRSRNKAIGIHQKAYSPRPTSYNTSREARIWTAKRGSWLNGRISSTKLTVATISTARVSGQDAYPRIKAISTAMEKTIPPPRMVRDLWEERSLGLSMILKRSAILK